MRTLDNLHQYFNHEALNAALTKNSDPGTLPPLKTTMAMFLSKLPLEIRNQIYGELLHCKESSIPIQGPCPIVEELRSRKQKSEKASYDRLCFLHILSNSERYWYETYVAADSQHRKTLEIHPEILQVCKQTQLEASAIFYSSNRFRYNFCKPCLDEPHDQYCNANFSDQADVVPHLDRIKHLEIAYRRFSSEHSNFWPCYRPFKGCYEIQNLLSMFTHIAGLGCSLLTLRLIFEFVEPPHARSLYSDPHIITRDEEVRQAVTALEVENRIEIMLSSEHADHVIGLDDFAQDVAQRKGWKAEKVCGSKNVEDGGKGEASSGEGNGKHQRRANGEGGEKDGDHMWVLRPMAKRAAKSLNLL